MIPNRTDWPSLYIGRPWVSGGRGPDSFDCWGFVWWVYKTHFGLLLPCYPGLDATDLRCNLEAFSAIETQAPGLCFTLATKGSEGAGIAMGACEKTAHVGIYSEMEGGLIIHCEEKSGVVASTESELRAKGIKKIVYFPHP